MPELILTDRESRRFKSLEDSIRRSAGDMYDAMRAIHDEKLYRAEFETWEEYCSERWGMSRANAYRLMEHGRILALLGDRQECLPMGDISERATRELAGLPDTEKVKVIESVASESKSENNGKPKVTAAAVRRKAQKIHPREPGDESEPDGADPIIRDELEREVPKHLRQHHEAAAQIKSAASKIDGIKKVVRELVDQAGGVFIPLQQVEMLLKEAKGLISQARYWTDCPRCKGKPKAGCDRCDGHGFLPFARRGTLSDEDKAYLGVER